MILQTEACVGTPVGGCGAHGQVFDRDVGLHCFQDPWDIAMLSNIFTSHPSNKLSWMQAKMKHSCICHLYSMGIT